MVAGFAVCRERGCRDYAVYRRPWCAAHCADRAAYEAEATDLLRRERRLEGVNLAGVRCRGLDLRERELIGCRFSGAVWENVRLDGSRLHHTYLDFAVLSECSLRGVAATLSLFAGATITASRFAESDLPRNNFVGLTCADTSFRGSDLSSCRFNGARLERVDFADCNLYHVQFETAHLSGINLRYSNPDEAHFS